ncbi:phosphatase PAP2 family protein [Promicromonospora kroppenstedtii]|uniref:phosphatase PAP2 family protein n=1 Tax=Promicromonospora kroppenstedtii TaxID=440482 RepID=UPI0006873F1A|nr:phosphatase PAP2 family protein [Promicromonospora kroppenstedtii]
MRPARHRTPARGPQTPGATRTAPRARRLVRAALVGVATGAAIVVIALLVREQWPPLVQFDERAVTEGAAFAAQHPELLRALIAWQWAFLAIHLLVPVGAICLVYWWRTGNATRTWWALTTILTAWGLSNLLKELARRARPVLDQPVESADGFSFPSGHAANTAAMTTALVALVWPSLRSRALRATAIVGAAMLTVATAVDRVMLGVHYPSDVAAGVLFGVGFVLASYLAYQHWSAPRREPGTSS